MDNEIYEVLSNYKAAIEYLTDNYKHLADEIAEIKTAIMDELINPIKESYDSYKHDEALSDFRCKYAEKLEPFGDKLKAIEGDDFDIVEKAFDDFSKREDGIAEEDFVNELSSKVESQLDAIAKAFNVEKEDITKVEIETKDEDGEIEKQEVEVEDGKTDTSEEAVEEDTKEAEEVAEEKEPTAEDIQEELRKDREELEKELEKYRGSNK